MRIGKPNQQNRSKKLLMEINIKITDLNEALRIEKALDFFYQTECFWVKEWNEQMKKENDFYNRTSDVLNARNLLREEIKKQLPLKEFIG